jgi:hypothetical protein
MMMTSRYMRSSLFSLGQVGVGDCALYSLVLYLCHLCHSPEWEPVRWSNVQCAL